MIEDIINSANNSVVINLGHVFPNIDLDRLDGIVTVHKFNNIKEYDNPDKQDLYAIIVVDDGNKYITFETSFVFNRVNTTHDYPIIDYVVLSRKEKLKRLCNK